MDWHYLSQPYLLMVALLLGSALSIIAVYKLLALISQLHRGAIALLALIPLLSLQPGPSQNDKDDSKQAQVKTDERKDDTVV